ncbi:hypothetical protein [Massilia sp. Root335]|uniref:hypothetical protein n=1 Tax=Massilia sp. Root335 TaxID=1736517 RepID=UPI0006FAF0AC|nr:hypothetical protein [Massilia sp. Root335]
MSTKSDAQIQKADNILAGLTDEQRAILDAAHWRYMAFAAGLPDEQFQEQAKADRQAYSHLLQQSAVGLSVCLPIGQHSSWWRLQAWSMAGVPRGPNETST